MGEENGTKKIQVFIASSIMEFQNERKDIVQFFDRLNKMAVERGIFFDVELCEEMSVAMDPHRKQDSFNEKIRGSKYFYMFIGNKLGKYTREEFEVAWKTFKNSNEYPLIYPFFIRKDDLGAQAPEVSEFICYLQENLKHFTIEYENFDAVLLKMLLELVENQEIGGVNFQDGQARLNGEKLLDLEKVSFYNRNEELKAICEELSKIDEEYFKLIEEDADDYSGRVRRDLEAVAARRNDLYQKKHEIEDAMYEGMSLIMEKRPHGMHPLEEQAVRFMNQGKTKEAFVVLQDMQFENEIMKGNEMALTQAGDYLAKLEQFISMKRYQISIIKMTGLNPRKIEDIREIYESLVPFCLKWRVGMKLLYEYASFLEKQKDYPRGIRIAEKLKCCYLLSDDENGEDLADALTLYGKLLYENKQFAEAEGEYRRALDILSEIQCPKSERIKLYNGLAELCWRMKRFGEGKDYLKLAVEVISGDEEATGNEDVEYRQQVARTFNLSGLIDRLLQNYQDALNAYGKAIDIRRAFMDKSFVDHALAYSETQSDAAFVYLDICSFDKAVSNFKETAEIREKLMGYTPDAVRPNLAITYSNLSLALGKKAEYKEALDYVMRSVEIRTELAKKNPSAFQTSLATARLRQAQILTNTVNFKEAEEIYMEAIGIWQDRIKKNFSVYASWLSEAFASIGLLYLMLEKAGKASEFCVKGYDTRVRMVKENIQGRNKIYVWICACAVRALIANGETEKAEKILNDEKDQIALLYHQTEDLHKVYGYGMALLRICQALLCFTKGDEEGASGILTEACEEFEEMVQLCPAAYTQTQDYMQYLLLKSNGDEERMKSAQKAFEEKYDVNPESFVNLRQI